MLVALVGSTSVAVPRESLTDFLKDGLHATGKSNNGNGNRGKGKAFSDREEDVAFLEEMTAESAAQAGVVGDYGDYSQRLAKTLSMLTPAQQARIFN